MELKAVMKQLESLGTAQNRKVYARHGATGEMFGVSIANIEKLKKDILRLPGDGRPRYAKHAHELGVQLWETGNHDARVLARTLVDPQQIKSSQLDAWIRDCKSHITEGAVVGMAKDTRFAETKMKKWRGSSKDLTAAAGWNLLCELALADNDYSDDFFEPFLVEIRDGIHQGTNRARYAMNNAVIAIGGRSSKLKRHALKVAKAIGTVEVDHGETNCQTPDAVDYIGRVWERKKLLAERRKLKKSA